MTAKYYIQIYRLSTPDGGDLIESIGDSETLSETDLMSTYAERWIHEIRPQSQDEAQCRAVMYRTILEGLMERLCRLDAQIYSPTRGHT